MTFSPPRPGSGERIRVGVAGPGAVGQAVHLALLAGRSGIAVGGEAVTA